MAYALGEESFTDLNANGIYDPGETFTDMPEPFLDANENGVKDTNEDFIDTNANGAYSLGDGIFNGILRASSVSGATTIHVRGSLTIVLSGTGAVITINNGNAINLPPCVNNQALTPISFDVTVADVKGNIMPAGTTIAFATTNGTILTPASVTVLSTSVNPPPTTYTVRMVTDATQSSGTCSNSKADGEFKVTVTTPLGMLSYSSVSVTD